MSTQYSIEDAPTNKGTVPLLNKKKDAVKRYNAPTSRYTIEDAPAADVPRGTSSVSADAALEPTPPAPPTGIRDTIINFFKPLSEKERGDIESILGKYAGPAAEGISNAAMGATSGVLQLALHPIGSIYGSAQTAADALNQLFPDVGLNSRQKAAKASSLARLKSQWDQIKENPDWSLGNLVGAIEGGKIIGEGAGPVVEGAIDTAKKIPTAIPDKFGPRGVTVGSETIPLTVGEAEPGSSAGKLQSNLKRSGTGSDRFEKVENAQQQAVKNVVRTTAQQTSGAIGPMQAEPADVVNDAATASFAQASPLYDSLDASLVKVPDALKDVSRITQDAITKARKLGIEVGDDSVDLSKITPDKDGGIQWGGTRISKATHPERWEELVKAGIIDDSGQATPLRAYRMVRSQLLKMQRSTSDSALRFAIGKDIETMTDNINKAIKGTEVEKDFTEANRLWSKGKALQDVSEAVRDATKGTPSTAQAPGIEKVPTKLQGVSLVSKLNDLYEDGTLEKAFTHDEIANLRQAADILDRIQRNPIGRGSGESMSMARGLTHAIRGNTGPLIGAGIGAVTGGLRGAELGAGIGFVLQKIGEQGLVRVMTKLNGVKALKSLEEAKTPAQASTAIGNILAVSIAANRPKNQEAKQ
jgi:hypothetical protein